MVAYMLDREALGGAVAHPYVGAGLIPGISNNEYHGGPGVSKSQLDHFARSPAHYLASLTADRKETAAMRIGTLLHSLVLEPDSTSIAVAPVCDKRTKAGKEQWEAFCAANLGAEIVTPDEYELLNGMRESIYAHPAASALLKCQGGKAEHSAFWTDEESGELCKCRPDFYRPDGIIVDLKTTEDASPGGFARSCAKYRYFVQSALYQDGVAAATGDHVNGFVFVAVEKTAPFATAVYVLDAQAEMAGRLAYREALVLLAECWRTKKFPAYNEKVETLSLPNWALRGVWE